VSTDALLLAMVDGTQIEVLEVAPATLHLQELLVAEGDILRRQRGIGGAEQELAVEAGLGLHRGTVDAEPAALGDAEEALEAGLGAELADELLPLVGGQSVSTRDVGLQLFEQLLANGGVARGSLWVAADHEAILLGAVLDDHLLDRQVVGHGVVAASW
jgi:hypothetical protein